MPRVRNDQKKSRKYGFQNVFLFLHERRLATKHWQFIWPYPGTSIFCLIFFAVKVLVIFWSVIIHWTINIIVYWHMCIRYKQLVHKCGYHIYVCTYTYYMYIYITLNYFTKPSSVTCHLNDRQILLKVSPSFSILI